MIKRNIFSLVISLSAVPLLVLLMQNCAKSETTTAVAAADCSYELACSDPNGNDICISGRVVDGVDRTANLSDAQLAAIELRLYEPVAFFSNPTGTAPIKTLTSAAGNIDSCGRYTTRINVATDTPLGSLGLVLSDLGGTNSNYVMSASVRQVSSYTNLLGVRNFLVSATQDQTWSTAAGLSGTTFATMGALGIRFYQLGNATDPVPGVGVAGVTPTWNGSFQSTFDYFFSDATLKTMQTIAPAQTVTGANGVAFFTPSAGFGTVSTTGSCTTLAGSPGTIFSAGSATLTTAPGVILFRDIPVSCN